MRRNLFLVLALFTALCISARADITLEQQTSPEYLINNGYSEAVAEQALMQKIVWQANLVNRYTNKTQQICKIYEGLLFLYRPCSGQY